MVAGLIPERDWSGPGCSDRCRVLKVMIPGVFGRSELLLHDAAAHEEYGRWQANPAAFLDRHTVVTGPIAVNLSSLDVSVDGQPISLTATELRILCVLARRVGEVISHDDLLSLAWAPEYRGEGHLLRVSMARLRSKLGPGGRLIATLIGSGYRLDSLAPGVPPPERGPMYSVKFACWARNWACCRICGTTDFKHRSGGICERKACRRTAQETGRAEPPIGAEP